MTARATGTATVGVSLVILLLAGCTQQRELVVHFKPGTTQAVRAAALHACTGAAPKTSPEPMPTASAASSDQVNDVRFRIDSADDRDIAQLETCLAKQPGVAGFEDTAGLTS